LSANTCNAAKCHERSRKVSKRITKAVKQQQTPLIEQQRPVESLWGCERSHRAMKESIKTAKEQQRLWNSSRGHERKEIAVLDYNCIHEKSEICKNN
jgi:hypothetical protein